MTLKRSGSLNKYIFYQYQCPIKVSSLVIVQFNILVASLKRAQGVL